MKTAALKKGKKVNGINIYDLHDTIKAFRTEPALGASKFRLKNQWKDGDTNRSTVGDFYVGGREQSHKQTFVYDNGEAHALLGKDEAANPVEYLLHALAGCVTTSTVMHAAARGINIKRLETTLEGDIDLRGLLGLSEDVRKGYQEIRVSMKIESDAENESLEELKKLYDFSPVLDTLRQPVNVKIEVGT